MVPHEVMVIVYSLGAALTWGTSDFSGGMASKKFSVFHVMLLSQLLGLFLIVITTIYFSEPFIPLQMVIFSGLAGFFGVIGLTMLYKGLADNQMGIVAPTSAVTAAALPVIFSFIFEGVPKPVHIIGLILALASVWFLSFTQKGNTITFKKIAIPLLSGVGFGLFFIFIDHASQEAILWPIVIAKSVSILMIIGVCAKSGQPFKKKPPLMLLGIIGVCDAAGNLLFVVASQLGRLDISATLSSLYPATTVFLAGIVLKEKLLKPQWIGVCLAFIALILISR